VKLTNSAIKFENKKVPTAIVIKNLQNKIKSLQQRYESLEIDKMFADVIKSSNPKSNSPAKPKNSLYFNPILSGQSQVKTSAAPKTPANPASPAIETDITGLLGGFLKKTVVPAVLWNAINQKYFNDANALRTLKSAYPEVFAKIGDGSSYKFSKDKNILINQIKAEIEMTIEIPQESQEIAEETAASETIES
jgi:hypothetical protein